MSNRFLLILVCFLGLMSYVSSDIYLPAFVSIQAAFSTSKALVGYTLSAYMLGLTLGQVVYGSLSDHFGRKTLLLFGLSLYVLASIACAYSTSIFMLIAMRFLQALGVCAAAALWQAMIVDNVLQGRARDRMFSICIPITALSPVVSPVVGGYLTTGMGWPAVFLMSAGLGAVLLYLISAHYHDGHVPHSNTLEVPALFQRCMQLVSSRAFLRYTGVAVFSGGAFFVYLTEIPFAFASLGASQEHIGLMFIPQTLAFIGGGMFSLRVPTEQKGRALRVLVIVALLGALVLLSATFYPPTSPWQYALPYAITAFSNGGIYPLAAGLLYEAHIEHTGMVAGLGGLFMALVGFVGSGLMATLSGYGVLAMAFLVLGAYTLAGVILLIPQPK